MFGGLSGHQGALRSAFLINAGLSREAPTATGVIAAISADAVRLSVYAVSLAGKDLQALGATGTGLAASAAAAAIVGSWLGSRRMKKVTLRNLQRLVGGMLLLLALVPGVGLVRTLLSEHTASSSELC